MNMHIHDDLEDDEIASLALRACIDATTRNSGVFSVAGVAFGYDRGKKASREWDRVLDGRSFHMTDLNARRGDFDRISDPEKLRIMKGTIGIINKYASFCFAVSCEKALVEDSLPVVSGNDVGSREMLAAFRSIYGMMCHIGMYSMGRYSGGWQNGNPSVSYIFEKGDEGQNGLIRFLQFLENTKGADAFLKSYSMSRRTVTSKDEMEGIFHSADLVAWEWAKHVERQRDGLPVRKSFERLSESQSAYHDDYGMTVSNGNNLFYRHYNSERLEVSLAAFRETLSAASDSEIDEALSRWAAAIEERSA